MTPKSKPLLSAAAIQKRVRSLGKEITRDLKDKNPVVVGVLKGSFVFMADLIRELDFPLTCEFIRVSSYSQKKSTGRIRLDFDLTQPIAERHVLLIEDIVDTGLTLQFLLKHLQASEPASVKVCSLLYKPVNLKIRPLIDYIGFTIPNCFVVGYGMDDEGRSRNSPGIFRL